MGINSFIVQVLQKIKPKKLLTLGYPDVILPETPFLTPHPQEEEKRLMHNTSLRVYDFSSLAKHLGFEYTSVDFKAWRGEEKLKNLDYPCKLGSYDFILDPGTLEHCFNIAQAFKNVHNALQVDGHVLHYSVLNFPNHGFYCISPVLYHDLYALNKYKLMGMWVEDNGKVSSMNEKYYMYPFMFNGKPPSVCILAQKKHKGPLKIPFQSKYGGGESCP